MKIGGAVAPVTSADRRPIRVIPGAGQQVAARAYGAARDPAAVTEPGVTPIALDITDPERVASVARECSR